MNRLRKISGALLLCCGTSFAQEQSGIDTTSLEALLETEISTAAKYAQTPSEAPASVTIITADEIRTQGYKTLADVLSSVRSFYITNERTYGHIGVRGFSRLLDFNIHTLILINGHTVNENIFGSSPAGSELVLDLSSVEKIEIVRGPGSALYGTGALFAVINIVTKKGSEIDGLQITGNAGSFGSTGGNLLYGSEHNGYKMMATASITNMKGQDLYYPEYDDTVNCDGWARGLDSERGYGLLSTLEKNNLKFQLYLSWRSKENPTGAWEMAFNEAPSRSVDSWNNFEASYDKDFNVNKHIFIRGYYDHYFFRGWYPYDVLNEDKAFGDVLGSEAQFRWDIGSKNRLTAGGEVQDHFQASYKGWADDIIFFSKNVTSTLYSLYLQDEHQVLSNLALLAGVRYDRYSNQISSTNPRVSMVYNPLKSSTLKLLYGKAFRKPNMYEIYYTDNFAGNKDNLSLKPEKIGTLECDWEQRISENVYGYLSYFNYRLDDLIEQVIDPADSLLQYRNMDKAKASGIESELRVHNPNNELYAYASYSYQLAKNTTLDTKLANNPEHMAKFGCSYPIWEIISVGADFLYESSRITAYDTKTKSYFLSNMNLIFRFHSLENENTDYWDHLELSLRVKNIFDIKYSHPVSVEFKQRSIEQDGRFIGVNLKWVP